MTSRIKGKESARIRAAEMRAQQARLERRRRVLAATAALAVVIVIVGGLVLAKVLGGGSGTTTATPGSKALPAAVLDGVTKVPTATSDKVGADGVTTVPSAITAPALTADGKPKVLYVGAEYCPFCAAERWPMVVALSRFGTWAGLSATTSSATDVFPSTRTVSFHGATLNSKAVSFVGVETETNKQVGGQYAPLDKLSSEDQKTFDAYNKPPFITSAAGGIPFIDIGGAYVSSGSSYDPGLLQGKTQAQIAKAINDPTSALGKAILASANVVTAAICKVTGDQPANVCSTSGAKAGAVALAANQPKK